MHINPNRYSSFSISSAGIVENDHIINDLRSMQSSNRDASEGGMITMYKNQDTDRISWLALAFVKDEGFYIEVHFSHEPVKVPYTPAEKPKKLKIWDGQTYFGASSEFIVKLETAEDIVIQFWTNFVLSDRVKWVTHKEVGWSTSLPWDEMIG